MVVKFSPCILHTRSSLSSVKTMTKYSHTFGRIIFHVIVLVVTVTVLANISECYCCKELEGNWEALTSDIVLAELQEGHVLNCDNNNICIQACYIH